MRNSILTANKAFYCTDKAKKFYTLSADIDKNACSFYSQIRKIKNILV